MMLEQIKKDQLAARKAGDVIAKSILTLVISGTTTRAKDALREPTDADTLSVINKLKNKSLENLAIYTNANESAKVLETQTEIDLLQSYLPQLATITADEINAEITNIVASKNLAKESKSMGALMGGLNAKFGAALDNKVAKTLVLSFLNS